MTEGRNDGRTDKANTKCPLPFYGGGIRTEKKNLEKRGPTYSIQTVVRSTCVPHVLGHLHVASSDGLFK